MVFKLTFSRNVSFPTPPLLPAPPTPSPAPSGCPERFEDAKGFGGGGWGSLKIGGEWYMWIRLKCGNGPSPSRVVWYFTRAGCKLGA